MIVEILKKLVIGLKCLYSLYRDRVFQSGVINPSSMPVGRIEVYYHGFVTRAIIRFSSSAHNFELDVGSISSVEVFDGA